MVQFCKPYSQGIDDMSLRMTLAFCRQACSSCTMQVIAHEKVRSSSTSIRNLSNHAKLTKSNQHLQPCELRLGACRFHTDPSGTFVTYEAKAIGSGSEGAQSSLQVSIPSGLVNRASETLHARGLPMLSACAFQSVCRGVMHPTCTVASATLGSVCPRCRFVCRISIHCCTACHCSCLMDPNKHFRQAWKLLLLYVELICHSRQLLLMLTLCSATGELPKGLELERCRGHGFVDFERSHGGKGNATVSAFCTYVDVSKSCSRTGQ